MDDTSTPAPPGPRRQRRPRDTAQVWATGLDGIAYGGDYNPEQWPEETWAEDVRLMREAGVTFATVGVFSWVLMEPREGELHLDWLDRVIDGLHAAGIRVVLSTPTAGPPAWLYAKYPDARVVTRDGVALGPGSRGAMSPSAPAYREACRRIADALAARYGSHPALALWHVHNEYGVPVSEDFSVHARHAFRDWLQERYDTVDELNRRWGTLFWGQRYGAWDEVEPPGPAASVVNAAHQLDWARFTDHQLRACFRIERDAIRQHSDVPVTTNFQGFNGRPTDLWAWADEVDIVSNDHYLDAADPRNHVTLAQAADLVRSVAAGRPWFLMEHSTSAVNWQPRNVAKLPGEMRRNSLQHVARGSDAVGFFQWRASRVGVEKFHSTMLPHGGTGTRVWREVVELGADLRRLADVHGSVVRPRVAILWDWESSWAQGLEWRPSVDLDADERRDAYYRALFDEDVTVDFAHPGADLSAYDLVVAPALYLLRADHAARLTRWVEDGGTLVVSYFSAIVDEDDALHPGGFGTPLREALGVVVEEFTPLRAGERVHLSAGGSADDALGDMLDGTAVDVWAEDLRLEGARAVATFRDGPVPGGPAVTRHAHGAGHGWYVAARLDGVALRSVLRAAAHDAGVATRRIGDDVELVVRHGTTDDFLFVVNHGAAAATLELTGHDLLTGMDVDGRLVVPAGDVAVVRSERRP
ncbi:beta-galactosidase [Luteimicrobium subarcticum]|uniref:Beta-galactosidase n=1 Tax=Luteimicrobium subarcticum TaxID=620910 RepID=A0A2M8W6X5_9MICO|nr:beta-galactosidase [Luteimicrobium subarcticum]PJI86681.1 beta-galactosidase [Luteimicrobium subarcticum]